MRTFNHKYNVSEYKIPGNNHTQYKIMQWHDLWFPHASQWPKPVY